MRNKPSTGFTLIELMITVAIIAIISAIAYPSYQEQVRETRRANAKADLLELVSFMERYYGENFTYSGANLPFTNSPKQGNSFYNLSFVAAPSASAYELQAVPTGGQGDDRCGIMTTDQNNKREAKKDGVIISNCW